MPNRFGLPMTVAARKPRRKKPRPIPHDFARLVRPPRPRAAVAGAGAASAADPYRVWLSEIMLQQTTVKAVRPITRVSGALADGRGACRGKPRRRAARLGGARLLRPRPQSACLRAKWLRRNMAAFSRRRSRRCARCPASATTRRRRSRRLPSMRRRCRSTAMSSAWWRGCSRSRRRCRRPNRRIKELAASLLPAHRSGDFAQALMDLGATLCSPKRPACALCPWSERLRRACARRSGDVSAQSAKARRQTAPRRRLRRAARRRPHVVAQAAGKRPARRHERSAGQRMGA